MMKRQLLKGNEALCRAAMDAGCSCFFGYPITPQNQVPEYLSQLMPEHGRVFVQAESEVAAINMVYGAASTGVRVMTSSSSPGISLKQEGISYLAGAELPAVIVNVMRGGPGLGNIAPSQADYFQATRGGGHGDYRTLVLAPSSVQEMYDLTRDAFELAEKYRNPVVILADAILGQMMEPVSDRSRTATGAAAAPLGRARHAQRHAASIINSLYIVPEESGSGESTTGRRNTRAWRAKNCAGKSTGRRKRMYAFVAYGSAARICQTAIALLAQRGITANLFRPISLYPVPLAAAGTICRRETSCCWWWR